MPPRASDALVPMPAANGDSRDGRANSVRRATRRRRPSPEELEAHFRELEAFKKQEERRKKDAEKRFKQQCIQEKRNVHRAYQQAQREANAKDTEVQRLLRQLDKVQSEQEQQKSRQLMQQERLDEALRKLREERYLIEQQYEGKLAEAGEARGRLDLMDKILRRDQQRAANESLDMEEEMERAQQELAKADIAQARLRIQALSHDNGRLRQELVDLRRAVASRRQKAEMSPLVSAGSPMNASFEVLPGYSPATTSTALPTYPNLSASATTSTFPTYRPVSGSISGYSAALPSSVSTVYSAAIPSTVSTAATARSVPTVTQPITGAAVMLRPSGSSAVLAAPQSTNGGPAAMAAPQSINNMPSKPVELMVTPQSSHAPSNTTELLGAGVHEKWNYLRDSPTGAHEKVTRLRSSASTKANESSVSSPA